MQEKLVQGVCWCKQHKKWKVRFGQKFIGLFASANEANLCAIKVREAIGAPVKFKGEKLSMIDEKINALVNAKKHGRCKHD